MEHKDCKVIGELAREIGVQPYRIAYAHHHGRLPEPPRVGGKRVYDEAMTEVVKAYFAGKDKGDPKEAR
jgi:DNA-binding transcriptional MerR regulator